MPASVDPAANSTTDSTADPLWGGVPGPAWALRLGVPQVEVHATLPSTNDRAHVLALAGARAGTVVLASGQTAGRGRLGRVWASAPGTGVWCSVVERPHDVEAIRVLALRVGLELAERLEPIAAGRRVAVKWPNDLFLEHAKVAGILLEARWNGAHPTHVVIGVGVNLVVPEGLDGAALGVDAAADVLAAVVGAVRRAAGARGPLTAAELARWQTRDLAAGRRVSAPAAGVVLGIAADGALEVETAEGLVACHAGSLTFA